MKALPTGYVPSFADFRVEFVEGDFMSFLKTIKAFRAGDYMAPLDPRRFVKGPKAYTSVQCGRGQKDHIQLNSDLVYTNQVNHSCEPNVVFDLSSKDPYRWHIRALQDIAVGTALTFFYPSTEWDMDQPFHCVCEMPSCLKQIHGAKYISKKDLLARRWVSPWILELVAERDEGKVMSQL